MANLLALSKLGNGLFTLILGLVVVFAGMLIIVLAVSIAGKIMKRNSEKGEKEKIVEPAPEVVHEVPAQPVQASDEIPEHIRVAIIAAIAAYYENNQPQNEFKVRKIKKLNNR